MFAEQEGRESLTIAVVQTQAANATSGGQLRLNERRLEWSYGCGWFRWAEMDIDEVKRWTMRWPVFGSTNQVQAEHGQSDRSRVAKVLYLY